MTQFGIYVMDTYDVLDSMETCCAVATAIHTKLPRDAGQDARKDVHKTARGYTESIVQKMKHKG